MKLWKVCRDKVNCICMNKLTAFGSIKAANCKTSSEMLSSSGRQWNSTNVLDMERFGHGECNPSGRNLEWEF